MEKYYKLRLGKGRKQYVIGKRTDPFIRFNDRYRRLEAFAKKAYDANMLSEKRQYRMFTDVWQMASKRLQLEYDKHLQTHGITRNPTGELIRMAITSTEPIAATQPTITKQAMEDLLERLRANDEDAIREFKEIINSDPDKWLDGQDLVSIAKSELYRCFAANDVAVKILLEADVQRKLDILSSTVTSPMEAMLLEHLQVSILAAIYNRLMLVYEKRSMRERSSFEKRAVKAESQMERFWDRFYEFRKLAASNWSTLPTDLALHEPIGWKRPSRRSQQMAGYTEGLPDENLCSMVI